MKWLNQLPGLSQWLRCLSNREMLLLQTGAGDQSFSQMKLHLHWAEGYLNHSRGNFSKAEDESNAMTHSSTPNLNYKVDYKLR